MDHNKLEQLDQLKHNVDEAYRDWFYSGLGDHADWDEHDRLGVIYHTLKVEYEQQKALLNNNTDNIL